MEKHTFLISDETENSHGFSILTEGIDTSRFDKNPVMLYMHQRAVVIGRWENLVIKDGKLFADAVFDLENEFSKEIAGKVERGFLKGTSMGINFDPTDMDTTSNQLQKCLLYEISIVDIGSNSNALKLYTDIEFKDLNFGGLVLSNKQIETLGFAKGTTEAKAMVHLKGLISENKEMSEKLKKIQLAQEKEGNELITELRERRIIKSDSQEAYYIFSLKQDFEKGKAELMELFPNKFRSFSSMVKKPENLSDKKHALEKPKAEWNLEDYRKHAPKELEKDPKLYQELINEKFKNTKH